MKRLAVVSTSFLIALLPVAADASPSLDIDVGARRYIEGESVEIRLSPYRPPMPETIDILVAGSDELVAQYYLTDEDGEKSVVTWTWDQRHACYGACQNVWEGEAATPGVYEVRAAGDVPQGEWTPPRFSIGAYFHLGFEGRPDADFVVYSNQAEVVEQMRAELDRPQEERQIVAGIVRPWTPGYNPNWSYVMGPRSIFLGEVFIEVCDGSPGYVERHLKQWRGEQWCPWSSYVQSEGQ